MPSGDERWSGELRRRWPTRPARPRAVHAPRTLTIEHAALYLDVSEVTIRRLIKRGAITALHVGSRVLVLVDSLDELIERGDA